MSHFTSKLALGKPDESVHWKMVKYSKGEFEGPVIESSIKGNSLSISGSAGYEDLIGWILVGCASDQLQFKVTGRIKSTKDRSEMLRDIGLDIVMKAAKGKAIYEAKIDGKVIAAKTLRELYFKLMSECLMLLTLKPTSGAKEWSMTTKNDYPRPSTKGESKRPEPDFCKAVLPASDEIIRGVISEMVPDFKDQVQGSYKQLKTANFYTISDIILPENKDKLDFADVRLKAKRKGVLTRRVTIDGREFVKKTDFCI